MTVIELISRMFPDGMDAFTPFLDTAPGGPLNPANRPLCPTWPPDLFAAAGTVIEQSGCYTKASPDHQNRPAHLKWLTTLRTVVRDWEADPLVPPQQVQDLWHELTVVHGSKTLSAFSDDDAACKCALTLFAVADEACLGMGWGHDQKDESVTSFSKIALLMITAEKLSPLMPYLDQSLCCKVSPEVAVVLPKSITASVGCTIRSLSHYLALLPAKTIVDATWNLANERYLEEGQAKPGDPYDVRVMLIPFPFKVAAKSFVLTASRQVIGAASHSWPAYFKLDQPWLESYGKPLSGEELARDIVIPLIKQAELETGVKPHGIVFPECALDLRVATELIEALTDSGIEFLIAGILHKEGNRSYNRACTFVIRSKEKEAIELVQNKHHRWRLDRSQTDRYALNFDPDPDNDKWWEDIDVSKRALPFFGLRKDMSFVTLICEDLARTDPAMTAIRAIGPNLVVALLMDGPQLTNRWPGKYATVLAEDPGCAVLTLTCAGMVDRANWPESRPTRSIGLWRDAAGRTQEIGLPDGAGAVLLTLQSKKKHQSTLDLRSDGELSRQLVLRTIVPLVLADWPGWV